MIEQALKFLRYLIGKKSEVKDLESKDALLAKTILDIHRKKTHTTFTLVPLFQIKQIHAIDRENAIKSTEERIEIIKNHKDEILQFKNCLTKDILNQYLPSVSGIKAVKEHEHSYIAYEGNGRLVALQSVFTPSDGLIIEVEEYHFDCYKKILRRMNRVRKHNKLR